MTATRIIAFHGEEAAVIADALSKKDKEIESLRQQLSGSQKREVMLRDALEYHQAQTRPIQRTEEALAATEPKP